MWETPSLIASMLTPEAHAMLARKHLLLPEGVADHADRGLLRRSAEPIVSADPAVARWGFIGAPVWQQPEPDLSVQEIVPGLRRGLRRLLDTEATTTAWDWTSRTELGQRSTAVLDHGDIVLDPPNDTARSVSDRLFAAVTTVIEQGQLPLVVGGDHSIGYPVISAQAAGHRDLVVVHLDAHADRRPIPARQTTADCGNFVTWCLDDRPDLRWLTIGVRGIDTNLARGTTGADDPVSYLTAAEVGAAGWQDVVAAHCHGRPVHVSVDIDVLDPSIAPEVAYPALDGLDPTQVRAVLDVVAASGTIVGLDLSEVCGPMTRRNQAAMLAVDLIHRTISKGTQ
ncbi:arginase family protein [Curtobacterium sp. MMLR14_006]|uniref:arginase family protein n=1 Tax=Curtobacterium sp. MMLR14_006 TaxID=1898742 RepID=UPI001C31C0A0|nr:arginase family protein [Curtobacterium sp. MMLR14_006]